MVDSTLIEKYENILELDSIFAFRFDCPACDKTFCDSDAALVIAANNRHADMHAYTGQSEPENWNEVL